MTSLIRRATCVKPTASVINLGCRVNRVESDKIAVGLISHGFELVDEEEAQLIVINTCAVTGEAEAKTRKDRSQGGRTSFGAHCYRYRMRC